jgi:hypothetical protein
MFFSEQKNQTTFALLAGQVMVNVHRMSGAKSQKPFALLFQKTRPFFPRLLP